MASTDEPERIEVELLSSAPSGASRPGSVTSTAGHDPEPLRGVGRRGVLVPLVVGIVALAAGWVIGRGSGAAPSIAPDETAATEAADPIDSIAPVPTTAASSSPPTSIAPATGATPAVAPDVYVVTERAVDVAAGLLGQPMEIVAFGNGRQLMRLDLATSRLVASEVVAQPFGRTRLLVGPTWALLPSNEAGLGSTLVRNEGRPVEVDVGPASLIVGVADADSLWVMFTPVSTTGIVVHRRGVDGRPRDEIGVVPSAPTSIDPAGGVVVELPGGTFGVRPQRAEADTDSGSVRVVAPVVAPITHGRLLALGADVAVAEECDALLVCSTNVIDRASGERRALDVDGGLSGLVPYGLAGTATVAPGGGAAVVEVLEPNDRASAQRSLGVIDLATGVVTEIGATQDVSQTAWTPDGRYLLFIRGGRLAAYDTQMGATVVVADELVAIDAFGVRVAGD